jgi:hypothetical protein
MVQRRDIYIFETLRKNIFLPSFIVRSVIITIVMNQKSNKGEPRYPRSFYLQFCKLEKLFKKPNFPVKMCLFNCEFGIRGPILQDVSTANNEAHQYCGFLPLISGWITHFRAFKLFYWNSLLKSYINYFYKTKQLSTFTSVLNVA